jgi:hypothetical protein
MVPPGAQWRKSSRSGATGACVEVRLAADQVQIRDSKDPDGPRLSFPPAAWAAFVDAVADGEFDHPA